MAEFHSYREAHVSFVHVYWAPDESLVGVLVTGGNIWTLAWDVNTGRGVPFDLIRKEFSESLRQAYAIPANVPDPIGWATLGEAQTTFLRLHPEMQVKGNQ